MHFLFSFERYHKINGGKSSNHTIDCYNNSYWNNVKQYNFIFSLAGTCVVHTDEDDTFFGTKLGKSRSCKTEHDITLKSDDNKDKVVMEITKLHLQPFDIVNGTFGEGTLPCQQDPRRWVGVGAPASKLSGHFRIFH